MLRKIIALWKSESFMSRVVSRFEVMLEDAEYLFTQAWEVLTGRSVSDEVGRLVYEKDKAINKGEREIRRFLAEHLTINPKQDVSGCLAMMSLVKDAERIGDYSKNMYELAVMLHGTISKLKYLDRISSTRQRIAENFPQLKKAFVESDKEAASKILERYASIKDECNKLMQDVFSEEFSTQEAVATVLLSRYLKRINSHMSNIASGFVYPIDEIDFVHGGLLE